MVQVGMAKQQAYEQNVTKIQSQIDAIGGLDVTRPVDRKYLQSKINELGSKLNRLASGDFSNFQLVNSVGGMTNQIVKDGVVQTAVNSTALGRKQREKIEKGKSDGTWSIENEDLYNQQYSKWYNGTEAGEAFNSEYIPYRDVYKKLREIAKDVGVEESLVQNLFNPDGSVNRVMVETYSKGKDPNKIYEAFVNGIDESDYRQLAITGRYKYKGYTNDQLVEMLQNSNVEYTQVASGRKLDIQQRLKLIDETLPTLKKPEEKKNLEAERTKLLEAISKIDEQVNQSNLSFEESRTKLASGDEEYANQIRSRIHTNKFLTTLSKDFADKTSYVKYADNPLWKAIMEEKKFAFEVQYKNADLAIKRAQLAFEKEKAEKEEKEKAEDLLAYSTAGAISGGSDDITVEQIQETYNNFVKDRENNYEELALFAFQGNSDAERKANMEDYIKSQIRISQVVDPIEKARQDRESELTGKRPAYYDDLNTRSPFLRRSSKTRQEVIMELGVQQFEKISAVINDKSGKSGDASRLSPKVIEAANAIQSLNTQVTGMKATMEQLEKETYAELGLKGPEDLLKTREAQRPTTWFGAAWDLTFGRGGLGGGMIPVLTSKSSLPSEVETKFQENLEQKYKEAFEGFYPENLGFVMNDKNRDVIVSKLNATLYKDKQYSKEIRAALFENNSQLMFTSTPSKTGFGETTYSAVVTDKDGTEYDPITITADQYKFLAGKEAPTPDIELVLTRARINASPDGSTNINGIGTANTSLIDGRMFTNTSYNIKGMDLLRSTTNPNSFYPMLYIAPPGSTDYQTFPIQRSMSLSEGLALPSLVTDVQLKAQGITF
jgi:hypothetical protein